MKDNRYWVYFNEEYSIKLLSASQECGLKPAQYIKQTVMDALDGKHISRAAIQQQAINLMGEVQKINNDFPTVDTSGLERIGDQLCRISL